LGPGGRNGCWPGRCRRARRGVVSGKIPGTASTAYRSPSATTAYQEWLTDSLQLRGSAEDAGMEPATVPHRQLIRTPFRIPLRNGAEFWHLPRCRPSLPAASVGCRSGRSVPAVAVRAGRPRFCPAIPADWNRMKLSGWCRTPEPRWLIPPMWAAVQLVWAVLRTVRRRRRFRRSREWPSPAHRGPPWRRSGPRRRVTRS
jgi:hypothetical protein